MKKRTIIFLLVFIQVSCTVRVPLSNQTQNLHSSAQKVQPYFQTKTSGKRFPAILGIGLGIPALTYLIVLNKKKDANGNAYTQEQINGNALAASAYVGGATIFLAFPFTKKLKAKTYNEQVTSKNFNTWLSGYNRKSNENYIKYAQDSYSYLLIPKKNVSAYEAEEKRIKDEAERQRVLAAQLRREQEERERIEREEQAIKERIAREEKEKKEREYAEAVARDPNKLDWKPQRDFGEDEALYPSYIISRMDSRLIGKIQCKDEAFHQENDCRSVLGVSIVPPIPNFEITLSIHDPNGTYISDVPQTYRFEEANKKYILYPTIPWNTERLQDQEQETTVNLVYEIGLPNQTVKSRKVKAVRLKTIYDCVSGYIGSEKLVDYKDYGYMFAGYVNESDPLIPQIVDAALKTRIVSSVTGYGDEESSKDLRKKLVMDQVQAIWTVMQNKGIKYASLTGNSYTQLGVKSQYVQPLSKVYSTSQGNCVDGTVAFASVLKRMGIDPLLVLIPGHCFLGFCTQPARGRNGELLDWDQREPVFLETTLIGRRDISYLNDLDKIQVAKEAFEDAVGTGNSEYRRKYLPNKEDKKLYSVIDVSLWREFVAPIGK